MSLFDWLFGKDEPLKPIHHKAKSARDERPCYHAMRRADCWYFQQGKCQCKDEAKR
jgi:hypothetical protein